MGHLLRRGVATVTKGWLDHGGFTALTRTGQTPKLHEEEPQCLQKPRGRRLVSVEFTPIGGWVTSMPIPPLLGGAVLVGSRRLLSGVSHFFPVMFNFHASRHGL